MKSVSPTSNRSAPAIEAMGLAGSKTPSHESIGDKRDEATRRKNTMVVFIRSVQNCIDLDDADALLTLKQLIENYTSEEDLDSYPENVIKDLLPILNRYLDKKNSNESRCEIFNITEKSMNRLVQA